MNQQKPIDQKTGFDISDNFERFDQRNAIYCRSEWDPEIQTKKATAFFQGHYMPHARARKADGFSQLDYALRNASWHVTNVLRDIRRESDDRKEGFFDTFTAHDDGRSICIRICPYNRDFTKWYNRLWRKLAGSPLRALALKIDEQFEKRKRESSKHWWNR